MWCLCDWLSNPTCRTPSQQSWWILCHFCTATWLTSAEKNPTPRSLNAVEKAHVLITRYEQGGENFQVLPRQLSPEALQTWKGGFLHTASRQWYTDIFGSLHFQPYDCLPPLHSRDAVMLSYSHREVTEISQQHGSRPTHNPGLF